MRDIRTLLIVILCIAVLSFGSYFMYKILDPVDNEIIEKGKTYLRLYIDDDGKITSQENDHQILKILLPSKSYCGSIKGSDVLCVEQTLWPYPHSITSWNKCLLAGEL